MMATYEMAYNSDLTYEQRAQLRKIKRTQLQKGPLVSENTY